MGNKSRNLKILQENNFLIPNFITIKVDDNFVEKIKKLDSNKKYAIRSDMLIEDGKNTSFAGQFSTFIDTDFENIEEKIKLVIADAKNKNVEENEIGVIVQEYIDFDYTGIIFTRNPSGGYEINIEYHKGIGENIVSGKIIPNSIKFYHWEDIKGKKFDKLSNIIDNVANFVKSIKNIEKIFNFPQDIEFGVKNGKVYFLQSRNITTISKDSFNEIKYIDNFILKENKKDFLYEKTEISEILPKVTNFTYNLLLEIYAKNGPIYKFYTENGIKIKTNNFLKVIGNRLFIDKQIELQNFFPSFTLYKNKYKKTFSYINVGDLLITLNNIIKLNFIKLKKDKFLKRLSEQIENLNGTTNFTKNDFLNNYKLIYEINFFTQKYFSYIEKLSNKLGVNFFEFINTGLIKNDYLKNVKNKLQNIDYSDIIGNSLDIEDKTTFSTNIFDKKINQVPEKFSSLEKWKQNLIISKIDDLHFFSELREIGRILTVLNVNLLRKTEFYKSYKKNNFEVIDYNFENRLSDTFFEDKKDGVKILSNFDAEGKIVDLEYLKNNFSNEEKYILYTKDLNPNLVNYFNKIEGIISEKGGFLSHLSIMCREYKKMLIISSLEDEGLKLGDKIIFKNEKLYKI